MQLNTGKKSRQKFTHLKEIKPNARTLKTNETRKNNNIIIVIIWILWCYKCKTTKMREREKWSAPDISSVNDCGRLVVVVVCLVVIWIERLVLRTLSISEYSVHVRNAREWCGVRSVSSFIQLRSIEMKQMDTELDTNEQQQWE